MEQMSQQSPPDSTLRVGDERSGGLDARQADACAPAIDIRNGRTRHQLEQTRGRGRSAERPVDAQQGSTDTTLRIYHWAQLRQVEQLLSVYPNRSGMDP